MRRNVFVTRVWEIGFGVKVGLVESSMKMDFGSLWTSRDNTGPEKLATNTLWCIDLRQELVVIARDRIASH